MVLVFRPPMSRAFSSRHDGKGSVAEEFVGCLVDVEAVAEVKLCERINAD